MQGCKLLRSTNAAITDLMRTLKSAITNPFMAVYLKDVAAIVAKAKTRELKPMDGMVLLALMSEADWSTGRINVTSTDLGERLGMQAAQIRACISRLKRQHLVRYIKGKGNQYFYCLNPWVVQPGTAQSEAYIKQCFQEA